MKKVFFVDDHPLILESLKQMFKDEKDYEVIGSTHHSLEAHDLIQQLKPDILVLDVSMPEMDAFQLVPELKSSYPELKIILYTMHSLSRYYDHFKELEVDGYVLKSGEYGNIKDALNSVSNGNKFFYDLHQQKDTISEENQVQLNDLEKEILSLLKKHLSNKEISEKLKCSISAVLSSRKNILRKTGFTNTQDLLDHYYGH